jgi:hypothetical protein
MSIVFFPMTSAEENKSREERKKTNKQTKTLLEIKHSAKKICELFPTPWSLRR